MNKNKFTLAVYGIQDRFDFPYPMHIHDHCIALFFKGKIVKYLQLERKTRMKHDNKMHKNICDILKEEKLIASPKYDIVFVDSIVGRSFISSNGNIRFEAPLNNGLSNGLEKGYCWWFNREEDAYVINHELAHIFSCLPFFGPFKENSLLVHFDGGASKSNFSVWHFNQNRVSLMDYHWDYKYLSSFYNANALNFSITGTDQKDQNSMAGKLMGLAAYGKYDAEIEKWLEKNDFFSDIWSNKAVFFNQLYKDWNIKLQSFDNRNPFIHHIAATFQHIFIREFIHLLRKWKDILDTSYLYFSGGSALNISLNSRIVNDLGFETVCIPPCTNDTGLVIGAGSYMEYLKHSEIGLHSPYLVNWGIEDYETDSIPEEIEKTANLLLQNKVIGICNGYGEIGPRALGNRSIVSLANSKKLAQHVSMRCKNREWYRPLAPIMLEKNAKLITGMEMNHLSKYMLLEYRVLKKWIREIEGVVHINGTTRIQSIFTRNENPFMFDLLNFLDSNHQVKALINTSFNSKGQPIIHTREDAITAARHMGLDAVIINGILHVLV